MKTSHELLAAAYAAFNAREIDTVLALLDPDVDWPNGLEGGRVLGPMSNFPPFAAAFSCKAGSAMTRPDNERCVVW